MVRAIDLARFRRCFVLFSLDDLGRWPQLWQAFGQCLFMKSVLSSVCNADDTISKMSCVPRPPIATSQFIHCLHPFLDMWSGKVSYHHLTMDRTNPQVWRHDVTTIDNRQERLRSVPAGLCCHLRPSIAGDHCDR